MPQNFKNALDLDFVQKGQKLAIAAACEKSQSFPPIFFLYLLIV